MRARRPFDVGLILLFAAALGAVVYGTLFRPLPPFDENRERHPPPPPPTYRPAIKQYPRLFDLYFADRVGYRDVLLAWYHAALYDGLGESAEKQAWAGGDGWLYLNVADPDEFSDTGRTLDARLDDWADEFADRADWLRGRGVEYVVLLAPEKSSVYPEHLPGRWQRHPPPEPLAAMSDRLKARGVRVVNPLPALLEAKAAAPRPLYYPQDTHWTAGGARVAYAELVKAVRATHPDWEPLPDAAYTVVEAPCGGDLRRYVLAARPPADDTAAEFVPPADRRAEEDRSPPFAGALPEAARQSVLPPAVYTTPAAAGPPAVLFCDSFGAKLLPLVTADFRRVAVAMAETLEPEVLAAERPAVVIQVMVARKLYLTAPPPPAYRSGSR
jgi:hypothetical protein